LLDFGSQYESILITRRIREFGVVCSLTWIFSQITAKELSNNVCKKAYFSEVEQMSVTMTVLILLILLSFDWEIPILRLCYGNHADDNWHYVEK